VIDRREPAMEPLTKPQEDRERAGAALRRGGATAPGGAGRARMRALVAAALAEGRVHLAFQPVVFAGATGAVAFHEGLVRIACADGGAHSPGAVLPAIAGTPEAAQLDIAVLRMALAALLRDPALRLSVNVAPETVAHGGWLEVLDRAQAEMPAACFRLVAEITETACLAAIPEVPAFLAGVRAAGASVALDDFGAGHTSLRSLREHRFDMIKIDGGYCAGLARDPDARCLVRALVDIARHFEMISVAERIACPADAAAAREIGVDCLQGHLFGVAEPAPLRRSG